MIPVVRFGDISSGHCFSPRPNDEASPDTFANSLGVHRQGDHWITHCCGDVCHDGRLASGSPDTFTNNKQTCRIGDPIDCGDFANTGSPDVFVN